MCVCVCVCVWVCVCVCARVRACVVLQDASPWGKHAPVYKLAAVVAESSMEVLGEDDEEEDWE